MCISQFFKMFHGIYPQESFKIITDKIIFKIITDVVNIFVNIIVDSAAVKIFLNRGQLDT